MYVCTEIKNNINFLQFLSGEVFFDTNYLDMLQTNQEWKLTLTNFILIFYEMNIHRIIK